MMEVFAGFLSHTDAQIGRVLDHLASLGVLDDTVVLLISDNGTSAEGGPLGTLNEHRFTHDIVDDLTDTLGHLDDLGGHRAYNHYPWGWAWAGNTPLRLWKRYSWLGGVRTPRVVHRPNRITAGGEVRSQFCHAIDLLPTVLDAVGLAAPAEVDGVDQLPIDGASLVPTFDDAAAPNPRDTQYFEMLGSRSIYHAGWKATTDHVGQQLSVERDALGGSHDYDTDHWSLFDLEHDFSESTDLGDEHPDRLRHMQDLWWAEAGANNVLPLEDTFIGRAVAMEPSPNAPRYRSTYRPGGGGVAEDLLPPMGAGFNAIAAVDVPAGGCEGVLLALGDWSNGWAWYVLDGALTATFNLFGQPHSTRATEALEAGEHRVRMSYERAPAGGGAIVLAIDDRVVGQGSVPHDLPFRWQIGGAGLLVGRDHGFPVCDDYRPPFAFTGGLDRVVIEIPMFAPPPDADVERSLRHE
jgi:arylsulfatase